jgi:integrase
VGLYDAEKLVAAAGKKVMKASKAKNDVLQREQLAAWFQAVQTISEPAHRAYLQALLLTGARPGELRELHWSDEDLQWNTITICDKVMASGQSP